MDVLKIDETTDTPSVVFNKTEGLLEICGRSYPEDTREFYAPILSWIDQYIENPNSTTTLNFKLRYFNSSSYKPLFDLLNKLSLLKSKKLKVIINWFYRDGDEDMKEAGEEFAELSGLTFSYHLL